MTLIFSQITHPLFIHQLFESVAIIVGVQSYRLRQPTGSKLLDQRHFPIILGALLGAGIGNKLVFWLEMPHLLLQYWNQPAAWFAGQSMVGGLLGGLVGVELAKKIAGISGSTGDGFVYPILLSLIIGRMGCFLAGLSDGTFGSSTQLPWGIDFGDGIARHPTQLYEIIFALFLWLIFYKLQFKLPAKQGLLFRIFLIAYLGWRLLIDFLKPLPFDYFWGFSGIQAICLVALIIYLPLSIRSFLIHKNLLY